MQLFSFMVAIIGVQLISSSSLILRACEAPYLRACDDGTCLPSAWWCDGQRECLDGSDEDDQYCNGITGTTVTLKQSVQTRQGCPTNSFKCDDLCVPYNFNIRCDGQPQCRDGNDEIGCTEDCHEISQFPCGDGGCIEYFQLCDGIQDCKNNRDETRYCSLSTTLEPTVEPLQVEPITGCAKDEIKCNDGKCIKGTSICDNTPDCDGAEDEFGCYFKTSPTSIHNCIEQCLGLTTTCDQAVIVPQTITIPVPTTMQTTTPSTTAPPHCPDGMDLVCGECMYVNLAPANTWEGARATCVEYGMHLFEIPSGNCFVEAQKFLSKTELASYSFWVGATDQGTEGEWRWTTSGTKVIPGTPLWIITKYEDMYYQQPRGGRAENCACLETCPARYLNDKPCSKRFSFLCSMKPF